MNWQVLSALISLLVGVAGGVFGAYVGMRVGIARIEVWKEIAAKHLDKLEKTTAELNEDSWVHDMEIGELMNRANIQRTRRQRFRD